MQFMLIVHSFSGRNQVSVHAISGTDVLSCVRICVVRVRAELCETATRVRGRLFVRLFACLLFARLF